MQLTELFLSDLEREVARSRRALEQAPEGHADWKPHEKSMPFGALSQLVATMPSWVTMVINQDELDLNPPGGSGYRPQPLKSRTELLGALDKTLAEARDALRGTSDAHLMTPWKLLVAGNVVMQSPRYDVIGETLRHLAHHRGQMTVYLRLLGATVPAIYGPSADDKRFD